MRSMYLYAVRASRLGIQRRLYMQIYQTVNVFHRHFPRHDRLTAHNAVEFHAGSHRLLAAVAGGRRFPAAVMELNEYFSAMAMHRVTDPFKALDMTRVINPQLDITAMAAFAVNRSELRNDQTAAAFCAFFVKTNHIRVGTTVPFAHMNAHGGHNDTVTQFQLPDFPSFK